MPNTREEKGLREGKFFAVISYISFLCIVSLVLKKDNQFALYHAKQGLALFVCEVISFILSTLAILFWLRGLGTFLFGLASIWGIIQALSGKRGRIWFISDIAEKIIL